MNNIKTRAIHNVVRAKLISYYAICFGFLFFLLFIILFDIFQWFGIIIFSIIFIVSMICFYNYYKKKEKEKYEEKLGQIEYIARIDNKYMKRKFDYYCPHCLFQTNENLNGKCPKCNVGDLKKVIDSRENVQIKMTPRSLA